MWLAFNYDQKGVQQYVSGTAGKSSGKTTSTETAAGWNNLAKAMRTMH